MPALPNSDCGAVVAGQHVVEGRADERLDVAVGVVVLAARAVAGLVVERDADAGAVVEVAEAVRARRRRGCRRRRRPRRRACPSPANSSWSSPAPPSTASLPVWPATRSLPPSPKSWSLPPAPRSVSLPSPPWTMSAADWPVKVSSPGPRLVVPRGHAGRDRHRVGAVAGVELVAAAGGEPAAGHRRADADAGRLRGDPAVVGHEVPRDAVLRVVVAHQLHAVGGRVAREHRGAAAHADRRRASGGRHHQQQREQRQARQSDHRPHGRQPCRELKRKATHLDGNPSAREPGRAPTGSPARRSASPRRCARARSCRSTAARPPPRISPAPWRSSP